MTQNKLCEIFIRCKTISDIDEIGTLLNTNNLDTPEFTNHLIINNIKDTQEIESILMLLFGCGKVEVVDIKRCSNSKNRYFINVLCGNLNFTFKLEQCNSEYFFEIKELFIIPSCEDIKNAV